MSNHLVVAFGDGETSPEIMELILLTFMQAKVEIPIETVDIGENAYKKDWLYGIAPSSWKTIASNTLFLKASTTKQKENKYQDLNVALTRNLRIFTKIKPSTKQINELFHKTSDIVFIRGNDYNISTQLEHRETHNVFSSSKNTSTSNMYILCDYTFLYAHLHKRKKISLFIADDIPNLAESHLSTVFFEISKLYKNIEVEIFRCETLLDKVIFDNSSLDVVLIFGEYNNIEYSKVMSEILCPIQMSCSIKLGYNGHGIFEAGSPPHQDITNPCGLLNASIEMLSYAHKKEHANMIKNAMLKTLENGIRTSDIAYSKNDKIVTAKEFIYTTIDNFGQKPSRIKPEEIINYPSFVPAIEIQDFSEKKAVIGYDVAIRWNINDDINSILQSNLPSNVEFAYIISNGAIIWPKNLPFIPSEHLICRIFTTTLEKPLDSENMAQCIKAIEEQNIEIISIKKLYSYGETAGFSE